MLTLLVVLFARLVGRRYVFPDDKASAHCVRIISAHLQQHNICRMPWPAMSPDLSIIEPIWDMIWEMIGMSTMLAAFGQALHKDRNRLPQMAIVIIIFSMPRQRNKCLTNRGGITH